MLDVLTHVDTASLSVQLLGVALFVKVANQVTELSRLDLVAFFLILLLFAGALLKRRHVNTSCCVIYIYICIYIV